MVIPPANLVAGFPMDKSQVPPELMVTAPVNVFKVLCDAVTVLTVPVIDDDPVLVYATLPMVNVAPVPTVNVPVVVFAAPLVQTAVPVMLTFPPILVITVLAVADPLMLKFAPMVVTLVIVFAPEPDKPRVL